MVDLSVVLAGLRLRNPILSASGTFGHGLEMRHIVPVEALGGWVSKTVTPRPRPGNPMPRIAEVSAGFLNSIGLENRGIESYLATTLEEVAGADSVIFTNIGGEGVDDFARMAERLGTREEIDLSCPNVDGGRLPFSTDPEVAAQVMRAVKGATDKPVFAKLSPNVTRIGDIAQGAEAGGADGLTAVNTALGMGVDWRKRRPLLNTVVGGYSGAGLKPIALRCAYECVQATELPVIGCGGITCAEDVLEFLCLGCHAVQVGTASFSDPGLLAELPRQVAACLEELGVARVEDYRGSLETPDLAPLGPAPEPCVSTASPRPTCDARWRSTSSTLGPPTSPGRQRWGLRSWTAARPSTSSLRAARPRAPGNADRPQRATPYASGTGATRS